MSFGNIRGSICYKIDSFDGMFFKVFPSFLSNEFRNQGFSDAAKSLIQAASVALQQPSFCGSNSIEKKPRKTRQHSMASFTFIKYTKVKTLQLPFQYTALDHSTHCTWRFKT